MEEQLKERTATEQADTTFSGDTRVPKEESTIPSNRLLVIFDYYSITSDDDGDNILYEDGTGDFLLVLASHGIELQDHFTFSC